MSMKTVLFGLLATVAAVSADAAAVTWQSQRLDGAVATSLPISAGDTFVDQWNGGKAYYFIVDASFNRATFITTMTTDYESGTTDKGDLAWAAFTPSADGVGTIARVGATYTANVDPGITTDIAGGGVPFYAIAVFVDNYGGFVVTDLISTTTPPTIVTTYTPPAWTYADKTIYEFGSVIPEPTAMALLALGAAAVGLRRRFRK